MMTKTLQKAFEEASRLPESEQDDLAAWLLDELRSEERWAKLLGGTGNGLERLADEALAHHNYN